MDFIVDALGFQNSLKEFIFKEVAILALQEDAVPLVYHFQPPYGWRNLPVEQKSENRWLESNYHGMLWSSGYIPYDKVTEIVTKILQNARVVFVKGIEKKKIFQGMAPTLYNLEDIDCPSFHNLCTNQMNHSCNIHTLCLRSVCAVQNVYMLKFWLLNHRKKGLSLESKDEVDKTHASVNNEYECEQETLYTMYT